MKKLLIPMFAIAAALVSCSKSEVMNSRYENIPISFTTYNGRTPEVKATSVTKASQLGSFETFAYLTGDGNADGKLYMNSEVEYSSSQWSFADDDEVYYWPSGQGLNFYAYGLNAPDVLTVTADTDGTHTASVSIDKDMEKQGDVLVATAVKNKLSTSENGKVTLQFEHLLSRIHFAIALPAENSPEVTIKGLSINGDFYAAGDIAYDSDNKPYIEPKNGTSTTSYEYITDPFTSDESCLINSYKNNSDNRYFMIIPVEKNEHGAEVSLTYAIANGPEITPRPIVLENVDFEAGKSYKFTIDLSNLKEIGFNVTITEWTDTNNPEQEETITLL